MHRPRLLRMLFGSSTERDQQRAETVAQAKRAADEVAEARRELARAVDDSRIRRVHDLDDYRRRALG